MATPSNSPQGAAESVVPAQATDSPEAHFASPEDVELHFETPTWLRAEPQASTVAYVPSQAEPVHDRLPRPANVPTEARWVAHHGARIATAIVLVLVVLGTIGATYSLMTDDLDAGLPYLAVPVIVILGLWARMISTTPVVLTLNGSLLEITQRGESETFDLADPDVVVATTTPDDPEWAVCFDRVDGTPITLTDRQFDPGTLRPVLAHYRALAQLRMAERLERYHR